MADLNLHNYGGLTGNQIVRVPHCGGKGLTVSGSQIDVDDLGGQLYIKRNLAATEYIAAYAATSVTQTLAPANVWTAYDALTSSVPAWLTSTGTIDANGVHLDGTDSLVRSSQTLSGLLWGFKFKLNRPGSIKISVGNWSAEILSGTNIITYWDGSTDTLKQYIHDSQDYDVVIEQKQDDSSQTATIIFRLGNITLSDSGSQTFSASGDLKIEGDVVIKGWRQATSNLLAPTLSLVESRSAGTYNDVDSAGTLYWGEMKTGYFNASLWSYKYNNTEYQIAGWTKSDYTGAGYLERRQLPGGTFTKIFDIPQSTVNSIEQGTWFPMRQWNFAQDSRGWIYLGTYGLGTPWASTAPFPDPPPSVYRSRDNGDTWERLPLNGLEIEHQRHCHSIYYQPDHDTLYASFGEYGPYNLYKFDNLSDTDVSHVTVSALPLVSRKGGISTRYNGTNTLFLPPDEFPVSFIRVNTDDDTVYIGPRHRGLFGCIKFALAPIPTALGTLLLSDATNPPEMAGIFLSYSSQYNTIEDVTYTAYKHSQTGYGIKLVGDCAYLGWNTPPNSHLGTDALKTGGTAIHEYWNGTEWVQMTTSVVTGGYSLPTDIADWAKAKPSDFGATAYTDEQCYWTRLQVTSAYSSGRSAYAYDDYDHKHVLLAIYTAYGDSCDTEVEWKIKTDDPYSQPCYSRDILFWESWKTMAVWSEMPFQLTASGSLNSTTLDPVDTLTRTVGDRTGGAIVYIPGVQDTTGGAIVYSDQAGDTKGGAVIRADKSTDTTGGATIYKNTSGNTKGSALVVADKRASKEGSAEVTDPTFDLLGNVHMGATIDMGGFVTNLEEVPLTDIFVNGKAAFNVGDEDYWFEQ